MKRIIPLLIIIGAIAAGYRWYTQPTETAFSATGEAARLIGSGSIEADTVTITAELGGRVTEVNVAEGDEVLAGEMLLELDKTDLLAQQLQLEAAIATANANLQLVSAPPRLELVNLAEAQLAQAEDIRDGAELVWQQAERLAGDPIELDTRISQMQAEVTNAEKQLELAQVTLKRAEIEAEAAGRDQSNNVGLAQNKAAQYQLQAAQQAVAIAEAAVAGTQKQVEHLVNLRNNPLTLRAQANSAEAAFKQAEAAVLAAQANLLAAKAEPAPEDVNIARAQLREAETGLDVVAVQLEKQTLVAPRGGLVSQKLINPGEMASPGIVLLELSDLETVELSVYIPETQIGRVQLGQKAQVVVDAYPDEVFEGWVSFIAHEAEFTPRNVQTQEERVNLVFAVKITLNNPNHRLKPGMPADAEILPEMWQGSRGVATAIPKSQTQPSPTATATPPPPVATATPTPQPTETPPTPAVESAAALPQAKIITYGLRVRSGPGVDFDSVGYLSQGDVVAVLATDEDSGWLKVQLPDGERLGWITGSDTFVELK
jgi:multidrug resistance efflux pump